MSSAGKGKLALAIGGVAAYGLIGWVLPCPEALALAAGDVGASGAQAMTCLGSLAFAICWWVGNVIAGWQVALLMIASWVVFSVVPLKVAFAPFAGSITWLLIGSFSIATAVEKTGLLKRISLKLMKVFPASFGGQATALMAAGLVCSPSIPSITAKSVLGALLGKTSADAMGYESCSKARTGLFMAAWCGFGATCPAFLTSSAFSFVVKGYVENGGFGTVTWMGWFMAMLPWLVIMLVVMFFGIRVLYAPKGGKAVSLPVDMADLGPMGRDEKISGVVLLGCVALWMTESLHGIDSGIVAVLCALVLYGTKVLKPAEIRTGVDWGIVIYVGAVLSLGDRFSDLGISSWFASLLAPLFGGLGNVGLIVVVMLVLAALTRFLISSQAVVIGMFLGIMAPILGEWGIHPFVVGLMIMTVMNVWFVLYQNPMYAAAFAMAEGTVEERAARKLCYVYVVGSMVTCLLCLPYWGLLGYA